MSAPKRISKDTEAKLCRGLEKIADCVRDGSSPNEAIVKAARDDDLPIDQVQLLIQAYNNARYNQQRKTASSLVEKNAHFALAEATDIFGELYPDNVKEAAQRPPLNRIADEYSRSPEPINVDRYSMPSMTKTAEVLPPSSSHQREPLVNMKKAWSLHKELDIEHDERRRLASATRDKIASAFWDLLTYFKQAGHIPLPDVHDNALALYGETVNPVFENLTKEYPRLLREKPDCYKQAVNRSKVPYVLIEECVVKSAEYAAQQQELTEFSKQAGEASYRLLSNFLPTTQKPCTGSLVKQADNKEAEWPNVLAPLSQSLEKGVGHAIIKPFVGETVPKDKEKLQQSSMLKLMDPEHTQKLRNIRSQAVFHDILANDELLSEEHPDNLAKMYNEITRVAPHAADQPLLMRALLRRYVQQRTVDPVDVGQLADIENKMRERERPIDQPRFGEIKP